MVNNPRGTSEEHNSSGQIAFMVAQMRLVTRDLSPWTVPRRDSYAAVTMRYQPSAKKGPIVPAGKAKLLARYGKWDLSLGRIVCHDLLLSVAAFPFTEQLSVASTLVPHRCLQQRGFDFQSDLMPRSHVYMDSG